MSSDISLIAGVDEVGRGPLAGAVIAAAVILSPSMRIKGLRDSKKLTEKERIRLDKIIRQDSLCWAIGRAEVEEIDNINILQASLLAMKRALQLLNQKPECVLVDGNHLPDYDGNMKAVVGGDDIHDEIAAASIIAKVFRDKEMIEYDVQYPQYGFARHKGYPTSRHLKALSEHGVCPIHRKTFRPVRAALLAS